MKNRTRAFAIAAVISAAMLAGGCSRSADVAATPPVASASAATATAVVNVSDIDVTEHVKTALHRNESLKGFDIGVVTLQGDVRLIGMLDSQVQVDEALRIARASEGVHAIHDELTIKK